MEPWQQILSLIVTVAVATIPAWLAIRAKRVENSKAPYEELARRVGSQETQIDGLREELQVMRSQQAELRLWAVEFDSWARRQGLDMGAAPPRPLWLTPRNPNPDKEK